MTEPKRVQMCTTDRVPNGPPDQQIRRSTFTWSAGLHSVDEAYHSLVEWARKNNYDAVVGIRLEAHPASRYPGAGVSQSVRWTIYGTAIAW
jgi:hypothetical protein